VKREEPGKLPTSEWRVRRVLQLYAAGESIARMATLVGWSEGRVRRVLREAGIIVPSEDGSHEK
jgi:predicted transcriptional regulator